MIRIPFRLTNPGQFFACCGLLELADRLWDGAEGWFEEDGFHLCSPGNKGASRLFPGGIDGADAVVCSEADVEPTMELAQLVAAIAGVPLSQLDPEDDTASPMGMPSPFSLRLDWWKDTRGGGDRLKVWAGSMRGFRIARAMQAALRGPEFRAEGLLDGGTVVYDPSEPDKKVEPFYFDARRGSNARPIDVGFSPDSLQMTSLAYPAVEFLCLVGLQRFRPRATDRARVFEYYLWRSPFTPLVAAAAACGELAGGPGCGFRFENAFRTDQRKHKGFTSATPI